MKTLPLSISKNILIETLSESLASIQIELESLLVTRDPESLHAYRVKIRMVRSIFKIFKIFIKSKYYNRITKILKKLQQQTNSLRDIDVFLENLDEYHKMISEHDHRFEILKNHLYLKHSDNWNFFLERYAYQHLNKVHIMNGWIQRFSKKLFEKSSEEKLKHHVFKIINKEIQKIQKASLLLSNNSPSEQFHILRLRYKKLRYISETLGLKDISKNIKIVQNVFGKVQDKNVQICYLEDLTSVEASLCNEIIVLLKNEIHKDKACCIHLSNEQNLKILFGSVKKTILT